MAFEIQRIGDLPKGAIKVLIYGFAGAGKTQLISTLPELTSTIVLSAEAGLRSLRKFKSCDNVPYVEIRSIADLRDAHQWITQSDEAKAINTVVIDSISEIADVCLLFEKKQNKDPRAAYGATADTMIHFARAFRDLDRHMVYMSAQCFFDEGQKKFFPWLPGKQLGPKLPHIFDEVFALRVVVDQEGSKYRILQTDDDGEYNAKDRSGCLDAWEPPDLAHIIAKSEGKSE